jgi:hypothetical protein
MCNCAVRQEKREKKEKRRGQLMSVTPRRGQEGDDNVRRESDSEGGIFHNKKRDRRKFKKRGYTKGYERRRGDMGYGTEK